MMTNKIVFSFDRIFYYSALVFAFTLPLSHAAVSFFVIWFPILFVMRNDYQIVWKQIKRQRVFHIMGAFIALMFLSILWSEAKADALNQIRLYSYWIIIPILASTLKRQWLPNIITAFLVGMFISEIIAYGIFFEWWTFKDRASNNPSPFMSYIHYSVFLATTSIILLSRLLSSRYSLYSKLAMLIFFLTSTGNLMISFGRTGQIAFFIAIGIAIIIHFRVSIKSFFLFVLLSSFIASTSYLTIEVFKTRVDTSLQEIKLINQGTYGSSWGLRAAFWIVTFDILHNHPFGVGIGDYRLAAKEALALNEHHFDPGVIAWCSDTHFHNQYLMILVQVGLLGFGLMLWLFIELFRLKISNPEIKEFHILGLTIFIVSCVAEPLWILQFPIILFIFIVSISLSSSISSEYQKEL